MEDPVRNSEYIHPQAYSSFLFNHLLQAQFYQVDSGGVAVSLNINNITFNNVNVTNNKDYTFVNGDNNRICVNKPGSITIGKEEGLKEEEPILASDFKVEDDEPNFPSFALAPVPIITPLHSLSDPQSAEVSVAPLIENQITLNDNNTPLNDKQTTVDELTPKDNQPTQNKQLTPDDNQPTPTKDLDDQATSNDNQTPQDDPATPEDDTPTPGEIVLSPVPVFYAPPIPPPSISAPSTPKDVLVSPTLSREDIPTSPLSSRILKEPTSPTSFSSFPPLTSLRASLPSPSSPSVSFTLPSLHTSLQCVPIPTFTLDLTDTDLPTRYRSSLFTQLLSKQSKTKELDTPEMPTTQQSTIYPTIDLLDFFGERELLRNNKKRLEPLLYGRRCNMEMLKQYTKRFLPIELRPMVWQLLFSYLPEERAPRECVLLEKQRRYHDMLTMINPKNHEELVNQIQMDVLRTLPQGYEDLFGNAQVKEALSRVLLVWAVHHPRTGYFQGLNDLASVFFATFLTHTSTFQVGQPQFFEEPDLEESDNPRLSLENPRLSSENPRRVDPASIGEGLLMRAQADAYWCLCGVLDNLEHLNAGSKCGVHAEAMMEQLEALVKRIDAPLDNHMKKQGAEYVHFSFPWMLCLFVRELKMDLLMVLWDFYASYEDGMRASYSVMHVYVCAAFLEKFRVQILSMEFIDMLKLLHHPPTQNWTPRDIYDLIEKAKDLYNRFPM